MQIPYLYLFKLKSILKNLKPAGYPPCFRRFYFPMIILFAFYKPGLAQNTGSAVSLYVTEYGLEEGLRQSMVSQVHQDSRGILWMVTGDGLQCFDGREFRTFRISMNGVFNNSDNMMRMMVENNRGNFIISSSSALFSFKPSSGKFSFIKRKASVYYALFDVLLDGKPLVWTQNEGLCIADELSLTPLNLIFGSGSTPPGNFHPIQTIKSANGDILVSGQNGVIRILINKRKGMTTYNCIWSALPGIDAMASDTNGNVFIVKDQYLFRFQGPEKLEKLVKLPVESCDLFFIDHNNNFWFTEKWSKKVFRYTSGVFHTITLLSNSGKHTDTISPSIRHIFEDKMHNLWIGTDGQGLLRYNPDRVVFNKSMIGFTRCLAALDDNIIAGTLNNGLYLISNDMEVVKRLNTNLFGEGDYILDLETDSRHRIWVASRKGLYIIDLNGRVVANFPYNCTTSRFIYKTGDTLYLQNDAYLLEFIRDLKPTLVNRIEYIAVNSLIQYKGARWTGTPVGLNYISFEPNNTPSWKKGDGIWLLTSEVFQLLAYKGEVWAATGNGIKVFSEKGKQLVPYPALQELNEEVIYSLTPDNQGRIWFTGIQGIGCITANRDRLIRFTMKNNLQSPEFNQNAYCKGENGWLYFGGINGINSINPENVKTNSSVSPVCLYSLFVADTNYSGGIPPKGLSLTLGRRTPHIRGSVFTSDYPDVAGQQFSFFLEGYQATWSRNSGDASFSYRNLPPGNYRLFVKYTDPLKNTGKPELLLTLVIKPAFWQTTWFMLLAFIMIVVITVLIVKRIQAVRFNSRIKALEQEHAIERERLRIARDMHDEVGASLTRISILSELAKNQQIEPERYQKLIQQISEISGNVVDELSEIIWAMNPKNDNLDSFAAYIRTFTSTYLEPTATNVRFHFPDNIPNLPMSAEIRRNLFLIVKESLHNVIKHARASNVTITLQIDKKHLEVIINDDGQGFEEKLLPGTGNGLHNMRRRIDDCGGSVNIVSGMGRGTETIISVDL